VNPVGRSLARLLALSAVVGLGGCATVAQPTPGDPLEGWNRGVQRFNDAVDDAVLAPVARTYRDVVPEPLRQGVGNFFGNLGDGWSAVNQFLQGKAEAGLNMTMRVATNTVFGLGGVLDVATEAGLERRSEDFGQTLATWGVGSGPYLVLPLLGPSTVRDTAALPLDLSATSTSLVTGDAGAQLGGTVLGVIHGRSTLLTASRLLDDIALDRYSFLRDAYLARRRNLIHDGNPPEERFDTPSK
jgi:phospholipid-binding lipoprotein MlaA